MPSAADRHGSVVALGRLEWPALVAEVGDARCVWSDLDGFHGGVACPEHPVVATHLWAWAGDSAWRFRIDGSTAYGARLDLERGDVPLTFASIQGRDRQGQTLPVDLDELAGSLLLVTTVEESPLSFLVER